MGSSRDQTADNRPRDDLAERLAGCNHHTQHTSTSTCQARILVAEVGVEAETSRAVQAGAVKKCVRSAGDLGGRLPRKRRGKAKSTVEQQTAKLEMKADNCHKCFLQRFVWLKVGITNPSSVQGDVCHYDVDDSRALRSSEGLGNVQHTALSCCDR
jgi:hypothetical protein